MRRLIEFLIKYYIYFVFILLETFAFILIINQNQYQRNRFFSSCNRITGSIYESQWIIYDYFSLARSNRNLVEENTSLQNKIVELEKKLRYAEENQYPKHVNLAPENDRSYFPAKVINSSANRQQNYITLNAGSDKGISPEMGVVSDYGVIGIVSTVSKNFSVVIPILNPKSKISCKLKRGNYDGTLSWSGENSSFANLIDVARHVKMSKGDTVITSGYTKVFPEGILVGTVEDFSINESDNYYNIRVRLAVDFTALSYVKVISYAHEKEQTELEEIANK